LTRRINAKSGGQTKQKVDSLMEQAKGRLEPVNIMAALSLCQLCTYLTWLGRHGGGWPT
jgi:hypothetical protein